MDRIIPGTATVSVTPDLVNELVSTDEMVNLLERQDARISDQVHYAPAVQQLESLAREVLAAYAQRSFRDPQAKGARFRVGSGTPVMRTLDLVHNYLSIDAANLLRHDGGGLSRYETTHTTGVLNHLKELRGVLLEDVKVEATNDLKRLRFLGVRRFVGAAAGLSALEAGDVPEAPSEAQAVDFD